jgi:hypothetical protein
LTRPSSRISQTMEPATSETTAISSAGISITPHWCRTPSW